MEDELLVAEIAKNEAEMIALRSRVAALEATSMQVL